MRPVAANPGLPSSIHSLGLAPFVKGQNRRANLLTADGEHRVGEVSGSYYYTPGEVLFHRRPVTWLNVTLDRAAMSETLRNSTGSIGTASNITKHSEEIEKLLGGASAPTLISSDASVENPSSFALEAHLNGVEN